MVLLQWRSSTEAICCRTTTVQTIDASRKFDISIYWYIAGSKRSIWHPTLYWWVILEQKSLKLHMIRTQGPGKRSKQRTERPTDGDHLPFACLTTDIYTTPSTAALNWHVHTWYTSTDIHIHMKYWRVRDEETENKKQLAWQQAADTITPSYRYYY